MESFWGGHNCQFRGESTCGYRQDVPCTTLPANRANCLKRLCVETMRHTQLRHHSGCRTYSSYLADSKQTLQTLQQTGQMRKDGVLIGSAHRLQQISPA